MKVAKTNSGETGFKRFKTSTRELLTKLSRAFMLPIAILPAAGLLLGIGGAIGANVHTDAAKQTADFFKAMSGVIFGNLPILFGGAVAMTFTEKNKVSAVFMLIIGFLVFNSVQSAFIHYGDNGKVFKDIFFFHKNDSLKNMVVSNLGIKSLSTSIFGGVIVGAVVAFIMNRWSEVELPTALSFFSGIRLVPMIVIPAATVMALGFLIFWPWVGVAIGAIGHATAKTPAGIDGLMFGMLGRALMPFGLHHIVIVMAWQTELGGTISHADVLDAATKLGVENTDGVKTVLAAMTKDNAVINGDQNIWNFINGLPVNRLATNTHGGSMPIFEWFTKNVGVHAGRFMQDYPIYLGACMGIGAAIICAADKDKRKKTAAITGSAMIVAFLTGITEPLEFSFLFAAPLFYYAIYVPLSGLAYMLMKVSGAHVGVGFARGFLDYIIYGAVPIAKGTRFYWAIPIAAGFGIFSFLSFYFMIKKFNWSTPGRNDNDVKLMTKKDFKKAKSGEKGNADEAEINAIVEAYGTIKNIEHVTACATRLRITVVDEGVVDEAKLKSLGAMGVIKKGKSTQSIFGGRASILAERISRKYGSEIKKK
ncbi:MAG: PTS transporter subunit EIIC [Mycoplasmatales bacterium]|nr:PTS transporter subunit EIIC [Mycoplasmatales bacterium]